MAAVVGGKAGGKGATSVGNGTNAEKVDEGLALAQRYGVDIDVLRSALQLSSAANHALDNWNNQTMAWAEDDMKIVSEMSVVAGIGLPQTAVNREVCRVLKPRRYDLAQYGK